MIITCHLLPQFNNQVLGNLAQVFNVGVQIFFIIAGFLYGNKTIVNSKTWLFKRGIRILIPLYIFILLLFFYQTVFLKVSIGVIKLILYLFNAQGLFNVAIDGAAHLWFLSIIMICYFITPLLDKYKIQIKSCKYHYPIICVAILFQVACAFFLPKLFSIYLVDVYLYIVAYLLGAYWDTNLKKSQYIILMGVTVISMFIRLVVKYSGDRSVSYIQTRVYECIIAPYSHSLLSLWIFITLFLFFRYINRYLVSFEKIVMHIDAISYEIYIVHYAFIVSFLSLLHMTNQLFFNIFSILICTYLSAILLKYFANLIIKKNHCCWFKGNKYGCRDYD